MADQVIWPLEALDDLEEIAKFIERYSHFYAASVITKILHTTKLLMAFLLPMMRVRPLKYWF
jgi:hypothetical protein